MKWLQLFEVYKKRKNMKVHNLSGIAVIVDERILLVHPKKFKKSNDKWSIPKGHIEGIDSLKSALSELEEETGIVLDNNYDDIISIEYKKGGVKKILDVYVYYLNKSDLDKYLGKGWEIKKKWFDKEEIFRSKFFSFDSAKNKIEDNMLKIIDNLR
jgi:predicted NUDIX family NTP pyrophosphohydrolase